MRTADMKVGHIYRVGRYDAMEFLGSIKIRHFGTTTLTSKFKMRSKNGMELNESPVAVKYELAESWEAWSAHVAADEAKRAVRLAEEKALKTEREQRFAIAKAHLRNAGFEDEYRAYLMGETVSLPLDLFEALTNAFAKFSGQPR